MQYIQLIYHSLFLVMKYLISSSTIIYFLLMQCIKLVFNKMPVTIAPSHLGGVLFGDVEISHTGGAAATYS